MDSGLSNIILKGADRKRIIHAKVSIGQVVFKANIFILGMNKKFDFHKRQICQSMYSGSLGTYFKLSNKRMSVAFVSIGHTQ